MFKVDKDRHPATLFRVITLGCVLLCTTACSTAGGIVHPQLGPINYSRLYIYNSSTTEIPKILAGAIDNALKDAEELDQNLYDALWWNDTYGFATGAGVFATGIATLAFGVFDASRTLLLASGVAATSVAGVRTFYPFAARNQLYSKGRTALQCAVQSAQVAINFSTAGNTERTGDSVKSGSLASILDRAEDAATNLREAAADVDAQESNEKEIRAEVAKALFVPAAEENAATLMGAVGAGRAVQSQIQPDLQVSLLQSAVKKIHVLVDEQSDALSPDPVVALSAAREQLNANLLAVKEQSLKARDLAQQVDNNKPKTLPTLKSDLSSNAVSTDAKEAVAETSSAAQMLNAKMATISSELISIDSCVASLGRQDDL